jgi:hypothetical protein
MELTFMLRGCENATECFRTFVIYTYETSVDNSTIAEETERYRQVIRVAAENISGETIQSKTIEADFATNEDGFYVAIQDETSCMVVERLTIFYNVCPEEFQDLAIRPQTIAPPMGHVTQAQVVTAQCVDQASHFNEGTVRLLCSQGGLWSSDSGCRCNLGFYASADRRSCIGIIYY